MGLLTSKEILDAGLSDWRKLALALHARFLTGDYATGAAFVADIAQIAAKAKRNPDVSLTRSYVDVKLLSHDVGQVTDRDIDLARTISDLAHRRGVTASKAAVLIEIELALDTADPAAIGPFWAALLTGSTEALHGDDVIDPAGRVPLLWFQHTDPHETPRQRFHLDVWVPHDVAEERIAAAVAAGGRVVDDREAPSFTVLADPEGNKACVCTFIDR